MGSLLLCGGGGGGGTGSGTVGRGPEPQARLLPLRQIHPQIRLKFIHKANPLQGPNPTNRSLCFRASPNTRYR